MVVVLRQHAERADGAIGVQLMEQNGPGERRVRHRPTLRLERDPFAHSRQPPDRLPMHVVSSV